MLVSYTSSRAGQRHTDIFLSAAMPSRFEDEMTSSSEHYATEQRAETGSLAVDLTGIKSQFESRKDEHLVIPALANKKAQPERSGFSRTAQATVNYQVRNVNKVFFPVLYDLK